MSRIIVISGVPGAGKSTLAGLLAAHFERSVHLEADQFQKMIVNGGRWPENDNVEGMRQLRLRSKNVGLVADSFFAENFTTIVDDIYIGDRFYHLLEDILCPRLYFVLLVPNLAQLKTRNEQRRNKNVFHQSEALYQITLNETPKQGLWIDTSTHSVEQSLQVILSRYEKEALLIRENS